MVTCYKLNWDKDNYIHAKTKIETKTNMGYDMMKQKSGIPTKFPQWSHPTLNNYKASHPPTICGTL